MPSAAAAALPLPQPTTTAATTKTRHTLRRSPWTYIHLSLHASPPPPSTPPPPPADLDVLTARQHLTAALRQHLGLHGTAVPIDILLVRGRDVWIRVPAEDGRGVAAACGAWVGVSADGGAAGAAADDEEKRTGWIVRGWDAWLGRLVAGRGADLFDG